jgi:cellulose synthase/poly-beta-1,6-N-acetylglucosamine synthase-like glycosyltransferase
VHWAGTVENCLFFLLYLPIGVLVWLVYIWGSFLGVYKMRLLDKPRPKRNPPPLCSILIPAKDEEARIASCLQSALDQDYPNFELIAVDDRSNDRTGAVMDEMAAKDSRLKALHIQPGSLGPGWTGKNNALFQGTKVARGDWLLFVDSDVVLQPTALRKCVELCAYKKYDLFSVLPALEAHTFWEKSLIPLCSLAGTSMYLGIFINNEKRNGSPFANGQFMLTTRTAYDSIGGHESVKDRLCEDTEMARLMLEAGKRVRVGMGSDVCAVRMYDGLANIIKGWSRIYYAARVGKIRHLVGVIAFLLVCCFTVYPMIAYGIYRALHPLGNMLDHAWLAASLVHLGLMTFILAMMYRWTKNSGWFALAFPVAGPMLLYTLYRGVVLCFTKKLEWRGTSYTHTMGEPAVKQG